MFLLAIVACTPPEETSDTERAAVVPPPETRIEIVPAQVDFGTLALGAPAVQVLSINNLGEGPVQLSALYAESDTVALDALLNTPIAPGTTEEVTVTWSPEGPASLSDRVGLLMRGTDGALAEMPVPLTGTAAGPVITVSVADVDFGAVSIGCSAEATLVIGNTGTEPLVVDNVAPAELSELTVTGPTGDLPAFPWTLAPYENRTIKLVYTPTDEGSLADLLQITTDDPLTPVSDIVLAGSGRVDEDNSITYDVGPTQNITAIIAMNQIAVHDPRFEGALPVFFDTLLDARVNYRVTFLHTQDGAVDGDVPYIDETMSADEAVATALEMVAAAAGDNDYLLQTLQLGIEENVDWLLDDGAEWEESRLSLVGMNSDTEQSTGNATVYVNEYLTYKDDPEDILVHAISGDVPRGCSAGSAFAEPAELLYNAANETGGTFLSWCTDWTTSMASLAEAIVGETQHFSLTGNPAEWSIEVWVNSARLTSGWSYDADAMEIIFEDEVYPAYGAEVRIDYIMIAECG